MILSVLVLWGVGELFASPQSQSIVPRVIQIFVFALLSVMMVGLLTWYLKSKRTGEINSHDDTEH